VRDGVTIHSATHDQVREEFDKILKEICLADGMWEFRADYVYKGVRIGGEDSAEKPRKVFTA
jgi:hypothetical protein